MRLLVPLLAAAMLASGAAAQSAPSVTFSSQTSQGDWVVVEQVHLPDGGFVAIHDDDGPAPDSVMGTSMYLEAGNHSHVPVQVAGLADGTLVFAVLHEDDGDQSFGYVNSEGEDDAPILHEGRHVAAPGSLEPGPVASIVFDEQDHDGELEIQQVYLPQGGLVAIHYEDFLDGAYSSSTAGVSEPLAPGNHTDVPIEIDEGARGFLLAVVHRDSDGDGVYDFDITQGKVDPFYIDGTLPVMDRGGVHGSSGGGTTVGAGVDFEEDNDTPGPALGLLLVALLALARRVR